MILTIPGMFLVVPDMFLQVSCMFLMVPDMFPVVPCMFLMALRMCLMFLMFLMFPDDSADFPLYVPVCGPDGTAYVPHSWPKDLYVAYGP